MDTSNPSHLKGKRPRVDKSESLAKSLEKDAFLISLAVKEDARPFGSVRAGEFAPNERGRALDACWRELGRARTGLHPDAVRIGPRHVQGILIFSPEGPDSTSLSEAVRLFKVLASLRLSQISKVPGRAAAAPGSGSRNAPATEASRLPGKAPSALWKKGYTERHLPAPADLAEARKALKAVPVRF